METSVTTVLLSVLLFSKHIESRNCSELSGSSTVSTSFGDISVSVNVNSNCTVAMIFEQPSDKGYTGWGFGGDYSLSGTSLMNGYSIMINTDGAAYEYELKRSSPYYIQQAQQDLDCNILNANNLLTVTCYRDLYTTDSMDYYDGWTKDGTIDVMWCWDKSRTVSPSHTHSTQGFTQMTMGVVDTSIYLIIAIVIGITLLLSCICWFVGKKCGWTACWKTTANKYCWNIFVEAYYGIFCCHLCKFRGHREIFNDEYKRGNVQDIAVKGSNNNNNHNNETGNDYTVQVR